MTDDDVGAIGEILDCAKRWIADEERSGSKVPPRWRRVIPLLVAAPDLFDAATKMIEVLERAAADARSVISRTARAPGDIEEVEGGENP